VKIPRFLSPELRVPAIAAACALVLVAAPWWGPRALGSLAFFRVRSVQVDGAHFVAPADIVARLHVDTMASVWDDARPLETRLRTMPALQAVSITRKLPGTLVVRVTEKSPVALIPASGDLRVYDGAGTVLPIDPTRIDVDLPIVSRPDLRILRLLDTVRLQIPALFARISDVRRAASGELVVTLSDALVRAPSDVGAERLAQVLPVTADLARRHVRATELDLRYRDQVIARLQ
jgi:cell division protein FtsQ